MIKTSHTREELFSFFRRSPETYLYLIGDLDDRFWGNCSWYSLVDTNGEMKAVALLFRLFDPPTFIAMTEGNDADMVVLINSIARIIPSKLYAHLSPGIMDRLVCFKQEKHFGSYHRMMLKSPPVLFQDENIRALTLDDIPIIEQLYTLAYPGNWFDKSMLIKGHYLGYFDAGMLAGIAGTHIFSPEYGVSALGNITTHPDYRGRGIGERLTSNLCHHLRETTANIGLNVKVNNGAAIRTYEKVGFTVSMNYEECIVNVSA